MVMHNREHLCNIRPHHGAFVAFTLHYPEEIKPVQEIEAAGLTARIHVDEGNLQMARAIVTHLSGDFAPEQYRDEYSRTLLEIIKAKAEGQELKSEPQVERRKVVNLMEALKQSVGRDRPGPPPGEKGAGPGRPPDPGGEEGSGR